MKIFDNYNQEIKINDIVLFSNYFETDDYQCICKITNINIYSINEKQIEIGLFDIISKKQYYNFIDINRKIAKNIFKLENNFETQLTLLLLKN